MEYIRYLYIKSTKRRTIFWF